MPAELMAHLSCRPLCRLTLLPFTLWDSCRWAMLPIAGIVSFLLLGEAQGPSLVARLLGTGQPSQPQAGYLSVGLWLRSVLWPHACCASCSDGTLPSVLCWSPQALRRLA